MLGDRYAPITSSIGFLEAPLETAGDALAAWRRELYPRVETGRPAEPFPEMLHRLEPLTGGSRPRELLVATDSAWTAYFDCTLRGTDAVSTIGYLTRRIRCRGLAVRAIPHTPARYGATQLELFGPEQTDFINYVRTVSTTYDGNRWVFSATGAPQPFERPELYQARRVRDRFTIEHLAEYGERLGLRLFAPAFYGPEAVLVESAAPPAPGGHVMTLSQAQQWLGIVG
ncbi:hypothetical protein [Actinoplanes sp. NPDC049118]|uniref:hypothetical protein n=1 Tax=Actinoplanes sp. NPDC049118 TaxID=3155769 RepID=UPI00340255BE